MEEETGKILSKILGKRDLDKVPSDILVKVEKFYDQRFEEFLTTKALYDIAQRNVGKLLMELLLLLSSWALMLVCVWEGGKTLFASRFVFIRMEMRSLGKG